jgi:hypothetical protein
MMLLNGVKDAMAQLPTFGIAETPEMWRAELVTQQIVVRAIKFWLLKRLGSLGKLLRRQA